MAAAADGRHTLTPAERERLWHGGPDPLPDRIALRAGPLTLTLEDGDLRGIRLGPREIVRRIYGAVRDEHWGTIPPRLSQVSLEAGLDHFRLTYVADHRERDVHFTWTAEVEGTPDGTLRFRLDGTARSTFRRNRIGLCVLHPIRGAAGSRVRATLTDGTRRDLVFPLTVATEQPMAGFRDLAGLAHEVEPDIWAEVAFDGEVFETEDQRNWIDASYKTYGTPLALPIPVDVSAGTRVVQEVTVRVQRIDPPSSCARSTGRVPDAADTHEADEVAIVRIECPVRSMPAVGVQLSRDDRALSDQEIAVLRLVQPAHLRADVRLADRLWPRALTRVMREAARLECAVELAVHVPLDPERALDALGAALSGDIRLARIIVFTDGRATTAPASRDIVRQWSRTLGLAHPPEVGTGTTGDLYRISLEPPPLADVLCWSVHPQAHAVDVTSIAETPEGARDQIESLKRRHPGMRLAVSPITLRAEGAPDPRQRSLFAAGWTLAMLRALSEAGADSLTFFETVGPAGLMDERGVFPMCHVFAAWASVHAASVVPTSITADDVAALWLTHGEGDTLLVANLCRHAREVRLPASFRAARLARIDASETPGALRDPLAFTRGAAWRSGDRLTLPPFGLARIDSN